MINFVLLPRPDHISMLLKAVPALMSASEYTSLDDEDKESRGLVFAAFARFVERSLANEPILRDCVEAMEQFASMNDAEGENLLITEVFENLANPDTIAVLLLPKAKSLFEFWKERIY